jgi:hypothetical protein
MHSPKFGEKPLALSQSIHDPCILTKKYTKIQEN